MKLMVFERTIQLIGKEAFERLQQQRVILFGIGGVGGWCAETLIRTGIRRLTIVDFDVVDETNINRQVVATAQNIGQPKVEEMRKRLLSIVPNAEIKAINCQYNAETAGQFNLEQYDYIIDAIDMTECKMLLLHEATKTQATVLSSMGAGRKMDTQQIHVAEFWKVEGCPLARTLRNKMKKTGLLPQKKIRCVYSSEQSGNHGTLAPVVGTFGMTLASLVIQDILTRQEI